MKKNRLITNRSQTFYFSITFPDPSLHYGGILGRILDSQTYFKTFFCRFIFSKFEANKTEKGRERGREKVEKKVANKVKNDSGHDTESR